MQREKKGRLKIALEPALKRLEITTHKLVRTGFTGGYKSIFKGRGLEFDSYRDYTEASDDASLIDWKATVRAMKPVVKEYVEERNLNVFFLVDVSDNMLFSSTAKLKCEYAAEVAASLAYTTVDSGDSIGFALFSDHAIKEVPCSKEKKQFFLLTHALLDLNNYGEVFNLDSALGFLNSFCSDGTLVIIISDFINQAGFESSLGVAEKKFDVIGIMIRDPRDITLPRGSEMVVLGKGEEKIIINPELIREEFARVTREEIRMTEAAFREAGCDFLLLTTDKEFVDPIVGLFRMRKMRFV